MKQGYPHFSHNWITNLPNWLAVPHVQKLIGKPNLVMLEIGSFEGRGTVWFLDHILTHATSRIYCVDPLRPNDTFNDHSDYKGRFLSNVASYSEKVRVLEGFSTNLWGTLLEELKHNRPDLIYIDGSHESADVLMDSAIAWRVSKPGTILVWDDYATPEEKLGADSFLAVMGPYVQVLQTGYQLMVQRVK